MNNLERDFLSLAKLSLDEKVDGSLAILYNTLRDIANRHPELSEEIVNLLAKKKLPTRSVGRSFLNINEPIPVDQDSRLELAKRETNIFFDFDPIWQESVRQSLQNVIDEKSREQELLNFGLEPSKSMLFVGPPGVGKTISAKWIAMKLQRPLFVLDLAAVMSSFLGKTGNNIRSVLDYAKKRPSVLLLDEFDAVAKKRDDFGEIGELKRLVSVLLQSIDDWPSSGLLIAATNHPNLLDPAVWRRFDCVIEFSKPKQCELEKYIKQLIKKSKQPAEKYTFLLSVIFEGLTFAEVEKRLNQIFRNSIIHRVSITQSLDTFITYLLKTFDLERRLKVAGILENQGRSQRDIHEITGCSRDTLRDHGIRTKSKQSKNT